MLRVPTIAETLATARAWNETQTGHQVSSEWGQGAGENATRQSDWRLGYKKDTYLLFPHLIPAPLISGCVLLFLSFVFCPFVLRFIHGSLHSPFKGNRDRRQYAARQYAADNCRQQSFIRGSYTKRCR